MLRDNLSTEAQCYKQNYNINLMQGTASGVIQWGFRHQISSGITQLSETTNPKTLATPLAENNIAFVLQFKNDRTPLVKSRPLF